MGESFDAGSVCLTCHPLGGLDVYGMKCLLFVFDVKTDRIYRTISAGEYIGDRLLVVDVSLHRLQLRIIRTEQLLAPFQMS